MTDEVIGIAGLIAYIKDRHGVNESQIARRIGVSPATVNAWVHRMRGSGRGPRPETLRKLAAEFALPEEKVFAAADRKTPGPVNPESEQRLLELFKNLTEAQQEFVEIQVRGLVEHNRRHGIIP
jgi:transcriptional regulator with XRE-family HTH domain